MEKRYFVFVVLSFILVSQLSAICDVCNVLRNGHQTVSRVINVEQEGDEELADILPPCIFCRTRSINGILFSCGHAHINDVLPADHNIYDSCYVCKLYACVRVGDLDKFQECLIECREFLKDTVFPFQNDDTRSLLSYTIHKEQMGMSLFVLIAILAQKMVSPKDLALYSLRACEGKKGITWDLWRVSIQIMGQCNFDDGAKVLHDLFDKISAAHTIRNTLRAAKNVLKRAALFNI